MIYLDHNATSPLHPAAAEAMEAWLRAGHGNPSSVHAVGRRARAALETARRQLASLVGADPLEVTFTSGGTEADALGVLGTLRALQAAGRPSGLLTSPLEHPAVSAAARQWASVGGEVRLLATDHAGRIGPQAIEVGLAGMRAPGLLSLALVNHELGNHYDLATLSHVARARAAGILVHCDAVQGLTKVPVSRRDLGVDLLSLSAHKIGGPAGVGALLHASHQAIEPLVHGGHQERGRRPGTEPALLAVGFGAAAQARALSWEAQAVRMAELRAQVVDGVEAMGAEVLGDPARSTQTALVHFPGCAGELLLMNLDLAGFAISTGSACSAGTLEPSPVVLALGRPTLEATQVIRISFGPQNTFEDVRALLEALPIAVGRAREAA